MWEAVKHDFDNLGVLINQYIGVRAPKFADALNSLGNTIGEMITDLPKSLNFSTFEGMGSMVGNIASVIISIIMCMLSAYFFIADREWLTAFVGRVLPENITHKYDVFSPSLKQAVGGYFKAQFRIEIWMYVLLLVGLTVLKVRYSMLIALLMAFLDFLPFFGTGIVLVPWAVVTVIGGNYLRAIGFLVIWGAGQLFRQLIQPKIIICLGRISACKIIKEDFKITREHGQWFERNGVWMTALFHPAAILRDPRRRPETFEDLKAIQAKIQEVCDHTY